MNETTQPNRTSDVPWPTSDHRLPVTDTAMFPGTEQAPPSAVDLLNRAVQGTHASIDRFADSAAPTVRRLGESMAVAEDALHAKTDQLRETRDEWVESARSAVRSKPLAFLAGAAVLAALIARVTR